MTDNQHNKTLDKEELSDQLTCTGCGAVLHFKPGTRILTCQYCGAENPIEESEQLIEEIDYKKFIDEKLDKEEKIEVVSVRCPACGAAITLAPHITSDQCPYCASHIVVKSGSTSTLLKPKSLLPFIIDKKKAGELFRAWLKKLWFAPSDLKKANVVSEKVNGIYVPYWTYDTRTYTSYTGQRGDYYYETVTYTTTESGRTVTRTRQVRRTRWTFAAGSVSNNFDDILVIASHSLPQKYSERLEPWNLSKLVPYNDKYLSGFRSESYQVDVTTGLNEAKEKMIPIIRQTVRNDIGGNEQRILTMNTTYNDVTFKHILLPVWISSYRFKNRVYRFLINGQTGEVQGERPWSVLKITLAVLGVIIVIAAIILLTQ